ncbi:hypothetical protein F5Y16DRAFT_394337 [Xylariaceae sp. FL0255]|nr:hypothetical protein F5Y16DRAFT_394337 [Xylariaceae sp. FL0255]
MFIIIRSTAGASVTFLPSPKCTETLLEDVANMGNGASNDGTGHAAECDGVAAPAAPPESAHMSTAGAGDSEAAPAVRFLGNFYNRNLGLALVFAAQTFGSIMNAAAKLLTSDDSIHPFHALHIIFVRMLATAILGTLYQWCEYRKLSSNGLIY